MKSSQVTKIQMYVLWLVVLMAAIVTRFYDITNKPIHFDESINGWFVVQMGKMGFYKYDPNNYHGPMYFYLLQAFEFMWGRGVATLRSVAATFGVFSVMLFTFGFLRSRALNWLMLAFVMISPAFLFYGRSGIHEMPFVFFQLLLALGVLRWGEKRDGGALALLLIGLFGMMVLKETFVLVLASFFVGVLFMGPAEMRRQLSWNDLRNAWSTRTTALLVFLLIFFVAFFTGFMRNPGGLVDFVKAFLPWMKTGVGESGHNKEFLYWVKVMMKAEPLAFFGVIMAFAGLFMKESQLRLMSAFSLTHLLIYSIIPYKTVWCILSLVWGFYFVLALFMIKFWTEWKRLRWVYLTGLVLLLPLQLRSDWLSVYRDPIDMDHPYVYVNSTYQLKALQQMITDTLGAKPELRDEIMQVGMKEQWPWPWILRNLPNVQYDTCGRKVHPHALFYLCDMQDRLEVEGELDTQYMKIVIPIRQSREASLVYLRKNIFDGLYRGHYEIVGPEGDGK